MPILLAGQHHPIYTHSRKDLQERDEERIPELLSASETWAGAGEATLGVHGIGGADVDPNECDGSPTSETMVALEEAEARISQRLPIGECGKILTCGGEHESRE